MPDRLVADKLGIPYHKVYEKRRRLGIPAMSKRKYQNLKKKAVTQVKKHHKEIADEIYELSMQ